MLKTIFVLCLLACFFLGCHSVENRMVNPDVVEELRGNIRVDKSSFDVKKPIQVSYWITNVSNKDIEEEILDGSTKAEIAFHTYSFNAVEEQDKKNPLELKEAGTPFTGKLKLMPGEEKLFCQNTFEAQKAGAYALSFFLRWKADKRVEFKPATITVKEAVVKTAQDREIDDLIQKLSAPDTSTRLRAKENLIGKGVLAVPSLIQLFAHENQSLRSDAMFTTISIGREAVPDLIAACTHKKPEIRMRSVYALGQIGDSRGFPVITSAMIEDPDQEVRLTSMRFINETLATPISIPLMIKALEDSAFIIRKEAIQALKNHTNMTFDFDPDASLLERKKSVDQWKEWWQSPKSNNFKTS